APTRREEVETAAGHEALQPDEEVGEEDDRAALGEAERDAVEIHGGRGIQLVMEGAVRESALHDHHADARRDARDEEEDRQERRGRAGGPEGRGQPPGGGATRARQGRTRARAPSDTGTRTSRPRT